MATAPSTLFMKSVLHINSANKRCEESHKRRRVSPGTANLPRMRRGRRRLAKREVKDSRRRAKLAMRVALSQRRSSSRRVGGGGCVRKYVRT
jgi:hypothetical protein